MNFGPPVCRGDGTDRHCSVVRSACRGYLLIDSTFVNFRVATVVARVSTNFSIVNR